MHALARRVPVAGVRSTRVPSTGIPVTWATAVERLAHGVHRYHDRVEVVPDRQVRRDLQEVGAVLDQALATARSEPRPSGRPIRVVRAVGRATGRADGAGPDGAQAVRDVLRAAALCSRAIEAALEAASARRAGDDDAAAAALATAREVAGLVAGLIDAGVARRPERRRFGRAG